MVSYAEVNANGKFGIAEDLNIKHIQEVLSMTQKPQNADAASENRRLSPAAGKRQRQIRPRHLSITFRLEYRLYSASSVFLLSAFLVSTLTFGGMAASSSPFPDPSRLPMIPIGLGTGHSLAFLIDSCL